jgi:hypothetical protein
MVEVRHRAIRRWAEAAATARVAVSSQLGDTQQGKEIKPANLAYAADQVASALSMRATQVFDKDDSTGKIVFVTSAGYKGAVNALQWWITKARGIVVAAEDAVARFADAEDQLRVLMAEIDTPLVVAPPAPKVGLPQLPPPPPALQGGSSYQDFDPRTLDDPTPRSNVRIETVVANDGIRVTGGDA